jgi:hypothetical protein
MSDLVIIQDKRGHRYHYTANLTSPVSQVLDSLSDYLATDKTLLELEYQGELVRHDQTFQEIGYVRLSSMEVTCPIDRVGSDRGAQLVFLEGQGITASTGSQVLEMSSGDLRDALTLAQFGWRPTVWAPPPPTERQLPQPAPERKPEKKKGPIAFVAPPRLPPRDQPPGLPPNPFSHPERPSPGPGGSGGGDNGCEVF